MRQIYTKREKKKKNKDRDWDPNRIKFATGRIYEFKWKYSKDRFDDNPGEVVEITHIARCEKFWFKRSPIDQYRIVGVFTTLISNATGIHTKLSECGFTHQMDNCKHKYFTVENSYKIKEIEFKDKRNE